MSDFFFDRRPAGDCCDDAEVSRLSVLAMAEHARVHLGVRFVGMTVTVVVEPESNVTSSVRAVCVVWADRGGVADDVFRAWARGRDARHALARVLIGLGVESSEVESQYGVCGDARNEEPGSSERR